MKKILIFFLLICNISSFAQHPLGESSLLVGNGYFKPETQLGDGTWRYAEARIIPWQEASVNSVKAGLYLSAIEVGSKIESFKHHSLELGLGLAINYKLSSGWRYDKYGWANMGYKKSRSRGEARMTDGLFESSQEDDFLFITTGIIFYNSLETFPFVRQKASLEYQKALKSKTLNKWEGETIYSVPWDNERMKINFENALAKINLSWQNETFLLPAIYLGYSHENGNNMDYGSIGATLTLAKGQYGREIINLSYQSKFDLRGKGRTDLVFIDLNILSLFLK